jgi:hypothetical protein
MAWERPDKVALARKLAVVLHRMLANGRASSLTKRLRPQPANKKEIAGSGVRDISRPEQGPVAGTMDQVRPMTFQQSLATARS